MIVSAEQRAALRRRAEIYHPAGLSLVPVAVVLGRRGKPPLPGWIWKESEERPAPLPAILAALDDPRCNGIAAVGGTVSAGGLPGAVVCFDFDDQTFYDRWAKAQPELAHLLPTVATGKGRHVWVRLEAPVYFKSPALEVFGDSKHYALLPGSLHPGGRLYEWVEPWGPDDLLPQHLPTVSLSSLWTTLRDVFPTLPESPSSIPPSCPAFPCAGRAAQEAPEPADGRLPEAVWRAIDPTLPTGPGMRNHCLWDLALALKREEQRAGQTWSADWLLPAVRRWWQLARPVVRTQEWEETWQDFARQWRLVRHPPGTLDAIRSWVQEAVRDDGGRASRRAVARRRLLLACAALQRVAGGGAFPLSARIAKWLAGCGLRLAFEVLGEMTRKGGDLELVTPGLKGRNSREAATYRLRAARLADDEKAA